MTNTVTLIGNLTRDPEIRYTPQGKAVVTLTVADTPRSLDRASGQWVDGVTDFVKVVAWENLAENVAASLTKGAKVVVVGKYVAEKYTDKTTNEERSTRKLVAEEVSPSLTFATAQLTKKNRASSSGSAPSSAPAAPSITNDNYSDDTPF
jgi:single-strand DNA-binding protein